MYITVTTVVKKDGTILELDFTLPHADYPVRTQIIVRWASSFMRIAAHAGMGVEFLTVTQGERDLIRSFVEAQYKGQMKRIIGMEEKNKA